MNIAWYLSFSFCHMHRLLRDLDLSSIPSSAFYMLLDTGKVNLNSLISQMGTVIPAYKGCCKLKWEHVYKALSKVPAQWKVKVKVLAAQSCPMTLRPHGLQPARLLCLGNFPGKNTGVDCQSLLQGIFLAQGSAPSLLDYMQVLYHLSHHESPKKSWSPQMQPYTQPSLPRGLGSRGMSGLLCS